jgi:carbamoyltransferase
MNILGIGGIRNDPAAVLLRDGEVAAAIEQKKVARYFKSGELPQAAIAECLKVAGVSPAKVDCAALVRPLGAGSGGTLHLKLREMFPQAQVVLVDHHTAHAASAYYPSEFDDATVLTLDREGDMRCGSLWRGKKNQLEMTREMYYPDSIGDLYGRVTALLGFEPNADEHKVQWLSASGDSKLTDLFLKMLVAPKGQWPHVNHTYVDSNRLTRGGFNAKFYDRLGIGEGDEIPENLRASIASGLQHAVEKTVIAMAGKGKNLALAGGLGLNAMLVAALENSGKWKKVFVQPAAGNAGSAIGAVFYAWHHLFGKKARSSMGNLCLGPSFLAEEIKEVLENCKLRFRYLLTTGELIEKAVAELNEDKIIAWMHGRMEFGSRALGNRSILASPRNPYSTENLNLFIKKRESFRKFAASVPAEFANQYFEVGPNARFLATVGRIRPAHRKTFEGALLGKDMVRVHLVHKEDNLLYWELLHAFGKATGLPVLYNTSFNLFGDPLVCSPRDAVRSFYSSGIDSMFVGNFHLQK